MSRGHQIRELAELRSPLRNAGFPILTPDQVRDIRRLREGGVSMYRLAKQHGVSAQAIAKVVRGQSHKAIV